MSQTLKREIPINEAIVEIVTLNSLVDKDFIYSCKIDLPKEIKMHGNKTIFQNLVFKLISQAKKSYLNLNNLTNKIILLTCKFEDEKEFSLSVTYGGKGLSYLSKKIIKQNILILRENSEESDIQKINKKIKKEFNGYLKLFSKKNKGTTIKCFFPLNQ